MNKLSYFLVFAVGAISGSAATYHFVKKKFEAISNVEIRSVKESFKKRYNEPCSGLTEHCCKCEEEDDDDRDNKFKYYTRSNTENIVESIDETLKARKQRNYDLNTMNEIVRDYSSTNKNESSTEKKVKEKTVKKDIYIIEPEEFGEDPDYKTVTLTYFADGTVAYDNGDRIYDVEKLLGEDALTNIGAYEIGCVHVRNETTKTDYEIYEDDREYYDVF